MKPHSAGANTSAQYDGWMDNCYRVLRPLSAAQTPLTPPGAERRGSPMTGPVPGLSLAGSPFLLGCAGNSGHGR